MPMAIVGRRQSVGPARCWIPNVCCECRALLPLGASVKVQVVTSEVRSRTRIDAYCDACGVKAKIDPRPLEE
jgi:RNase P subunit RPR2